MNKNILGILFLLSAFAITMVWTKPMWEELKIKKEDKFALEATRKRFEELSKKLEELRIKYASISDKDKKNLREMMPSKVDYPIFLMNLDSIASARNTRIKQISIQDVKSVSSGQPENKAASSVFEPVSLSFSISASYDTFKNFLSDLEKNRRLIDVDSISFSSSDKKDAKEQVYNFSIKANIYWKKP